MMHGYDNKCKHTLYAWFTRSSMVGIHTKVKKETSNKMRKEQKQISASEFASVLVQAITGEFVRLGIVQVNLNPESVPATVPVTKPDTSKLQLTRPTAQNPSGMVLVPATAQNAPATIAEAMNAHDKRKGSKKAQVEALTSATGQEEELNKPDFGDGYCRVGKGNGGTKLPKSLFEGYDGVILQLPNGEEHAIRTDSEGRGKLTLSQTSDIGATRENGDFLVFIRDAEYGNVFEVVVWSGRKTVPATRRTTPAKVAPVVAPTKPVPPVLTRASTPKPPASQVIMPTMRRIFEEPFVRVTDEVEDAFQDAPVPARFQYTRPTRATR